MSPRVFSFLLLAVLVGAHGPGLAAPAAFDDEAGVLLHPRAVHVGAALEGFLSPLPASPPGMPLPSYAWRPLTELSFALNRALTGDSIVGLRLGNLLLLAASAVLLLWALRALEPVLAPWAALFFAAHPFLVHAATYVYPRSVLLEAALLFLTLGLYWRGRIGWAWLSALLAMGAKEPAVTLPLVLLASDRARGEGFRWRRWLPFALLPALVAVQVLRALPEDPGGAGFVESGAYRRAAGYTRLEYLGMQTGLLPEYLRRAFLPFPFFLNADQVLPLPGRGPAFPWGWAVLLFGLAAWTLFGPARHRRLRLAAALFFSPLALECSIFPIKDLFFHHRAIPGLVGAGLAFGLAASRKPLLGAVVIGCLALGAARESRLWTDPQALRARDVRSAFHVASAWTHLAGESPDPRRAERLLRPATRMPWLDSRAVSRHAKSLADLGRLQEARVEVARGLRALPESTDLLGAAVEISSREGDEAALDRLADRLEALRLLPPPLAAWLVERRWAQGKPAEAILARHLEAFPEDPILARLARGTRTPAPPASP